MTAGPEPGREPAAAHTSPLAPQGAEARSLRRAAIRVIAGNRLFRLSVISLVISGVAVSSANPQLALFFVDDLHAPVSVAGLYYLTNLVSPIVGFLIGRYSDRVPDRLRLFRGGALLGAAGWVAMAASTQVWMPFVISVVALGVASAASAQVYAAVRDELSRHPGAADTVIISTIRMSFTLGWIVGPVLGGWIGAEYGLRILLLVVAALNVAMLIPMIGLRAPTLERAPQEAQSLHGRGVRELMPLFAFSALCMLALSGDTLKFAFLPVFMQNALHTPAAVRGAVISTQPVFELLLIPVAGWAATRFGALRVMVIGAVFGVFAHLAYATSSSVSQLFVGQFLMSLMWACMAGLGVTVAQNLYPRGAGVATSTFLSTTVFASTLGGLIGSLGVTELGLPHVFFVPAVISAVAVVGLVVLAVLLRRSHLEPAAATSSTKS